MRIRGRTGDPAKTGYYTLPEFVTKKSGYCFEIAQFGFWFFSELGINSVSAQAALTSSIQHEVIKLASGKLVDYSRSSQKYRVPNNRWSVENPIQILALNYDTLAEQENPSVNLMEKIVIYDKYDLSYAVNLMYAEYSNGSSDYQKIISLGEFVLQNIDIEKIIKANHPNAAKIKGWLKAMLLMLGTSYFTVNDRNGVQDIQKIFNQYFKPDKDVQQFLKIKYQ
jgi:hypothetical protein